eukprot:scaffold50268_cov30-Tisochrysis_lutea.AAC.1
MALALNQVATPPAFTPPPQPALRLLPMCATQHSRAYIGCGSVGVGAGWLHCPSVPVPVLSASRKGLRAVGHKP